MYILGPWLLRISLVRFSLMQKFKKFQIYVYGSCIFFVLKSVQVRNQHKKNTYECFCFHSCEFSLCGFFPDKKNAKPKEQPWCTAKCLGDQNERFSESRIYLAFNNWVKSVFEIAFSLSWICVFTRNFVDLHFCWNEKEFSCEMEG